MTMVFEVILATQRKKNTQSSKDSLVYFITELFLNDRMSTMVSYL